MRRSWGLLRRSILAFRRVGGVDRGLNVGSGFAPPPTAKGDWRAVEVKVEWGRRCLTTSADTKVKDQADASSLKRHVPVKVGADLQICTDTDVDVVTGQSLEEIVLEAKWKAGERAGDWSEFQLIESAHHVKLGYGGGAALEGIRAAMPARWCSLSVEAKQNPVRIQSLKEGTLNVETSGGHVTVGDMRGGWAKILTNGGCFTADVVSADSVIKTSGGDVSIKRLVGTTIDVDTNGGDIHIGSLYGNDVVMKSSGGSFEAKHIQAQDSALVSTEGGSVQITGIDGKASIVTSGGAVSLQLHEHAREIDVDASLGAVTLYFSNNLCAQVEYNGNGRAIDQASQILRATREPGHYSFIGSESWRGMQGDFSRASRSEEASQANKQQPQVCHIRIVSAGSLHVKMRSWIDVAMQSGLPSFVK